MRTERRARPQHDFEELIQQRRCKADDVQKVGLQRLRNSRGLAGQLRARGKCGSVAVRRTACSRTARLLRTCA
jgi:hypothetical protein